MKQLFTFLFMTFLMSIGFSQGNNWKTDGNNNIDSSGFAGTTNNIPFILKSNSIEGLRLNTNGTIRIFSLDDNLTNGLVIADNTGVVSKLSLTGNNDEVFTGAGSFVSLSSLSGWTISGNTLSSGYYNVGINTTTAPEKLTVNGNILASGSISGTSLNVVDIVTSGKEFKISTSLCMKGIDLNDPNSRNEICGMNGDLFIQSENNNFGTIFNYGNAGKVGFGILPSERFHVGTNARFDAGLKLTNIPAINETKDLLFIDANGDVVRGGPGLLAIEMFANLDCLQDINGNTYSIWHSGFGKVTTGTDVCENTTSVGINVSNPLHNLHVIGSGYFTNTGNDSYFFIKDNGGIEIKLTDVVTTNYTDKKSAFTVKDNNGSDVFRIYNDGRIFSTEVSVRIPGQFPDYVFTPSYKLMPLEEVKSFIETEKHLPNVPTAAKVESEGLNVGEMQVVQMEKIEELTLYLIQLNDRLKFLEAENLQLKEQIKDVQKQVK